MLRIFSLGLIFSYLTLNAFLAFSAELNIYSHRQPFLINPFLKEFEKASGARVNVVFADKGLVQRLLAEGERSPADVVLAADIARLDAYSKNGLFARVVSEKLQKNIPPSFRDPRNRWFGFSIRARVLVSSKDRVKIGEILRIEDLANPNWKGRVCTRAGSHVYNRALLASIIAANGHGAAEKWARGLVSNLARRPQGNDRAQAKAIYEGVCDIAIINSYYFGYMKNSNKSDQRQWADALRVVFTNQGDRGNHVNISGGGVARYSKNRRLAIQFLEFLTEPKSQKTYGETNYEFPVNPSASPGAEVKSWGDFRKDTLPIEKIADLAPAAQKIIDRVGW
jgi:iron(III) transport system substrate-binding protein